MAFRPFLAMTAAEIRNCAAFPPGICWMACHFSPYGLGLSNLPRNLPPGSILMLDDITPIRGHDPDRIAAQLEEAVGGLQCTGVLLDFQRPGAMETAALAQFLAHALPCPVAISDLYAANLDCPVFLSAPPCHIPLEEHIEPWQGREIWLEMAMNYEQIILREEGAEAMPFPCPEENPGFAEEALHCHYQAEIREDHAVFSLWRTREDLDALLEEAQALGISMGSGLYQELGSL